jgi:hypothetical protein
LGCRLNYAEMAAWDGNRLGRPRIDSVRTRQNLRVEQLRRIMKRLARAASWHGRWRATCFKLIVTGCYATPESEMVEKLPNVKLVVGNERKDELSLSKDEVVMGIR